MYFRFRRNLVRPWVRPPTKKKPQERKKKDAAGSCAYAGSPFALHSLPYVVAYISVAFRISVAACCRAASLSGSSFRHLRSASFGSANNANLSMCAPVTSGTWSCSGHVPQGVCCCMLVAVSGSALSCSSSVILLIASSRLLLARVTSGFVHRIIACVGVAYASPLHAGHRDRAPRVTDSTSEGSSAKGIISLHWCVFGNLLVSCAAPVPCGWGGSRFRIRAYAFVAFVFRVLIVRLIWSSKDSLTSSSRHGAFSSKSSSSFPSFRN